jgi:copper(I)-binding protein
MKIKSIYLIVFIMICAMSSSCGSRTITIEAPWARTGQMGANSAVYFEIRNSTNEADSLIRAESDISTHVELHRSMMVEGSDAMTMQKQDQIEIPAAYTFSFEPGGYHVMLIDLKDDLVAGGIVELTLVFEKAGAVQVDVEIREP